MTNADIRTLFHHDARNYEEAAAAAAANAEEKLHGLITKAHADLPAFLERLDREHLNREDSVLPVRNVHFDLTDEVDGDVGTLRLHLGKDRERTFTLHDHALEQALGRGALQIPAQFGRALRDGPRWQRELLVRNLEESFGRSPSKDKTLVRAVSGTAKAVLSDRYAVMDTRPLFAAFCEAVVALGAVPLLTHSMDIKNAVKVIFPRIYSLFGYERIAFGVEFRNSDYGAGALDIRVFVIRLWCTNFATMESELRKVHLGSRLIEGIALSHETHGKVQEALLSAIRDIVNTLSQSRFDGMIEQLSQANTKQLEGPQAVTALLGKYFGAKQTREIVEVYSGAAAPIEALPPGNTQYRLSQAIGFWAQQQPSDLLRLDAEEKAGRVLMHGIASKTPGPVIEAQAT